MEQAGAPGQSEVNSTGKLEGWCIAGVDLVVPQKICIQNITCIYMLFVCKCTMSMSHFLGYKLEGPGCVC